MTAIEQLSPIAWAREHGHPLDFEVALDYTERRIEVGHGWLYYSMDESVGNGILLEHAGMFREGAKSGFLIDDGLRVQPYYVAGWHRDDDCAILHSIVPSMAPFGRRWFYYLKVKVGD